MEEKKLNELTDEKAGDAAGGSSFATPTLEKIPGRGKQWCNHCRKNVDYYFINFETFCGECQKRICR